MAREGLDTPRGTLPSDAHLIVSRNTDQFALLAPTIVELEVREVEQELVIVGMFGTTGDLAVTVNGIELPVKERHATFLVVGPLPSTGPASTGDVRVSVNQHLSNVVQLTSWNGRLIYDFAVETLKQRVTFDVHLRADVHSFRLLPGGTPAPAAVMALDVANDSIASYESSGVYSAPYGNCTITHTWSGSGPIPLLGNGTALFYSWHGVLYPPLGKLDVSLDAEGPAGTDTMVTACPDGTSQLSGPLGLYPGLLTLSANGIFHVGVGSNFTIQGATFQTTIPFPLVTLQEVATLTLSLADMTPASPPDPNAHR